jgi:hypothetical protein
MILILFHYSFKQNSNSEAAKKLLQYENFTHNTNEIIDKAFLEGLKLAQQILLSTQPSAQVTDSKKIVDELFTKVGGKKTSKGLLQVDGQHWYMDMAYWTVKFKNGRDELFFYPDADTEIYIGSRPTNTKNFILDENIDTRSFTELAADDAESDLTNSMRIYAETVKANNGVKPKMFMADNFTWSLNQNNLYNLLDKVTGFTFLKNVDLETGNIVPEPVSPSAPVSEQKVNKMFKQIAAMIKNEHIADLLAVQGIDTRDIYEQLRDAETEADLNKINQTLLKALC